MTENNSLLHELKKLVDLHRDPSVDDLTEEQVRKVYQGLRYSLAELLAIHSTTSSPEKTFETLYLEVIQLKRDFKDLLAAFAFDRQAPLPTRDSIQFQALLRRYRL